MTREWQPEGEADPKQILNQARADAVAGRHADALAKYLWFHHHALEFGGSLAGVRLSYALAEWRRLGQLYPPAQEALEAVRTRCEEALRSGAGRRDVFMDFQAISYALGKDAETVGLFRFLADQRPSVAEEVFDLACPSLVRARAYELCGRYLRPGRDLWRLRWLYRMNIRLAADPRFGQKVRDCGEQSFCNRACTLVALLAVNGRGEEAARVARVAGRVWRDGDFHRQLERALAGEVPRPWP